MKVNKYKELCKKLDLTHKYAGDKYILDLAQYLKSLSNEDKEFIKQVYNYENLSNIKSIKRNVQFISFILLSSIILTIVYFIYYI